MAILFNIRPGQYLIPNYGNVDTQKELSEQTQVELYLLPNFPFIEPTDLALPLLKKQKLKYNQLSVLVSRAKTVSEVEILSELNSSEKYKTIIQEKLATFI